MGKTLTLGRSRRRGDRPRGAGSCGRAAAAPPVRSERCTRRRQAGRGSGRGTCIVMAFMAMACMVMAYIFMARTVMAYIVMAVMAMAYMVMAYILMARTVMAYVVMAYVDMVYVFMAVREPGRGRSSPLLI